MMALFDSLVYAPIYNVLIFLYNTLSWHDFGIAIVLTTIILKLVLLPLSKKQIESQKKMQDLQPKIKELQQKYKNDKEKQTRAVMDFYKENKINPVAGCLPLIIQLTFLIAIYRVLINISQAGLQVQDGYLYSFVANPGQINHLFLGLVDLSHPNYVFAVLAALAQYYQTKIMMQNQPKKTEEQTNAEPDFAQIMTKQMLFIGPFMTLFIGITFPAGLSLYWLVSTLFMIIQQEYILKTGKTAA